MNHVRLGAVTGDPVARARDLGPAIAAAADEIERTQDIPEPLLTQLHDARLSRMLLPRSVGGDQVEPWTYLHAVEEIARHDGSVGWNMFVANSSALIAPFIPLEAARDDLRRSARPDRLGAAQPASSAHRRARRLPRHRRVAFRQRAPPGQLDGRALHTSSSPTARCG